MRADLHECSCPWVLEGGIQFPEAGVAGSCEPPDVSSWELNLGPLEDKDMLLATEPARSRPTNSLHFIWCPY